VHSLIYWTVLAIDSGLVGEFSKDVNLYVPVDCVFFWGKIIEGGKHLFTADTS
jgi:hypothetical protein